MTQAPNPSQVPSSCPSGRRRYRTKMHAAVAVGETNTRGRVVQAWTWCEQCHGYHLNREASDQQAR